jgi:ankyrin repeat protein
MLKIGRLLLAVCIGLVVAPAALKTHWESNDPLLAGRDSNSFALCRLGDNGPKNNAEQTKQSAESLALFYAAGAGDYARVQSLIKAGFDVNGRDEDGMTPLFAAARNGKATPAIIALLVSAGCDVNARDKVGETALLYAIDPGGDTENIKALLDAGADVDIPNVDGETPLMRAADWGSVNVLRMLLEKSANPNLKGWRGKTALMIAAKDGEYESVVLLLAHKSDAKLKDNSGNTALSLAIVNFKTRGRVNRHTRRPFIQTINLLRRVTRASVKTTSYPAKARRY